MLSKALDILFSETQCQMFVKVVILLFSVSIYLVVELRHNMFKASRSLATNRM